jgi:NAD(P)-dependent dehydrogenase (short-subunit alcohol dehydrogenase family)
MSKTILITGSTDGIGFETAKMLLSLGHKVLLHGRNATKLAEVENTLSAMSTAGQIESYVADLSRLDDVEALAKAVSEKHSQLDVLINNAGVLKTPKPVTDSGLDVRFMVNTFAPYRLTQRLMPLLGKSARVVNLSSAAQSHVDLDLLAGKVHTSDDFAAYAQSKLALTMWSRDMALKLGENGPMIVAVNPGSLLASKMVKEGFGMEGKDIGIGADILTRAAISDEFEKASGLYFDNDSGQFTEPHPDGLNPQKCEVVMAAIEMCLNSLKT